MRHERVHLILNKCKYCLSVSQVTRLWKEWGDCLKSSILLSMCIGCFAEIGVEGWLTDRSGYWAMRFHRDEQSDASDPHVFVDYGRGMPNGQSALLKSRKHLPRKDAETQWNRLIEIGWTQVFSPVWGQGVEP